MDLFTAPSAIFNFVIGTLLPFFFVLTIVVFFHELGHFLVGRWNRVKVETFAVGFGPELFGFNDKHGTRWKFCAIPLGGYVKFLGDSDGSSRPDHDALANMNEREREGAFESKALWRRAAIVAAGPIANFILAIVIYTGLFSYFDDVKLTPVVGVVMEDSAAETAGFKKGDQIVAVNGDQVEQFADLQRATMFSTDSELTFLILRDGKELTLKAVPRMTERTDPFGNKYKAGLLGIMQDKDEKYITRTSLGPIEAFAKAVDRTWGVVTGTYNFLKQLILGQQEAKELRGPIGIGQITSQVATLGVLQLLSLAAVLSVSIGLLNLMPIPVLDGGHLMFYAIEAVRGRALQPKTQDIAYRIGITCVLGLMLFATSNDILRLLVPS